MSGLTATIFPRPATESSEFSIPLFRSSPRRLDTYWRSPQNMLLQWKGIERLAYGIWPPYGSNFSLPSLRMARSPNFKTTRVRLALSRTNFLQQEHCASRQRIRNGTLACRKERGSRRGHFSSLSFVVPSPPNPPSFLLPLFSG